MGGGYVLDFTDNTFEALFNRYNVDIHSERYEKYGTSKANKMRVFWEEGSDSLVGSVLPDLLEVYEAQCELGGRQNNPALFAKCQKITSRLSGKDVEPPRVAAEGFLNEEFKIPDLDKLPVEHTVLEIIHDRLEEAQICLKAGAHLSVILQCGSVLEAVLLGAAQRDPKRFNSASSSPKQRDGKVKAFRKWTLSEFINVAHDVGLLKADVREFSHGLRDFRNYIHPYQQMVSEFRPDEYTAKVCFQVLKAALADVSGER